MRFDRKITLVAALLTATVLISPAAWADSTVHVSLWDNGSEADLSRSMGLGMGMKGDIKSAPMGMKLDKATVAAGKVTFIVNNTSKQTIHEMIAAPVEGQNGVMPFLDNENRVAEDKAGDVGEVSELDPGKSGALTVDLKPGKYILYCNIPGHYMAGMWAVINVK